MYKEIDFHSLPVEYRDRLAVAIQGFVESLTAEDHEKIAPGADQFTLKLNMSLHAKGPGTPWHEKQE